MLAVYANKGETFVNGVDPSIMKMLSIFTIVEHILFKKGKMVRSLRICLYLIFKSRHFGLSRSKHLYSQTFLNVTNEVLTWTFEVLRDILWCIYLKLCDICIYFRKKKSKTLRVSLLPWCYTCWIYKLTHNFYFF